MRIKVRLSQHRRDFRAVYVCQFCGHEVEGDGYDDTYFHQQVIPNMVCPECGKTGDGPTSSPIVPAGVVL